MHSSKEAKESIIKKGETIQEGYDFNCTDIKRNRLIRWLLISAGTLFVGLGILGIFLPLLPTTPFLLLAAACYARSSKRFHHWLLNNRLFGNYIKNYQKGKGIPIKVKFSSIILLWIAIIFSAFFVVHLVLIKTILILIAIGVSIHILSIRTIKHQE